MSVEAPLLLEVMVVLTSLRALPGEGTRNVSRLNHPQYDDMRCPIIFSSFLYTNFFNICTLRSNFQSIEHHISSKIQLFFSLLRPRCQAMDSSPFSLPFYFIFISKPKLAVASMHTTISLAPMASALNFQNFPAPG